MGSVEISEIERKVLPTCEFFWKQGIINQSAKILEMCDTKDKVSDFFKECVDCIKDLGNKCRIIWNGQVQTFGGDEYAYIVFFFSDILNLPIKVSLKIDPFEQAVVVGNMDIATKKEEGKLNKDIKRTVTSEEYRGVK